MNLKTRFRLIILSMVVLLLSVAVIMVVVSLTANSRIKEVVVVDSLVVNLYELKLLNSEYIAAPSARVKQQLWSKYRKINDKLIERRDIPDDVKEAFNDLQQTYVRITSMPEVTQNTDANQKRLRNQIAATLNIESQRIIDWASDITLQTKINIASQMILLATITLTVMLFVGFILIAIMIFTTRHIFSSIIRLKKGAEEIAAGKLGFQVENIGNDEITTLGKTINQMSLSLMESYNNLHEQKIQLETEMVERQIINEELQKKTTELEKEIEERHQAEVLLKESETKLQAIFDTVGTGILIIDKETQIIIEANPTALEMTGLPKDKIIGHICHSLVCPAEAGKCPVKDLGQSVDHSERNLVCAYGHLKDILKTVHPITINGRDCYVESFTDISERKRAEEEKAKLEKQLFQSQKMEAIGTLAGGIAHDFNNILAVIIGYTEMARDRNKKENKEHYLQEALKGAERARNLVKQILTFSRQDDHEKKPLDIKVLLKEAIKFLRSSIPTTVEINQHITAEECNIMADPTQMHQIIMNLCTNASHAMKETGGTLKIELANIELVKDDIPNHPDLQPGHYVKLTVSDTGHGIDPALIQSIFDPFFTTKSVDEGTGLGLSVVYGIVKGHGGVVNVYSEHGKGAVFHVYLPRIIQTETIEVNAGKPVIGGTERILFVDDEPSLVDIGTHTLSSLGYDVTGVLSSVEALNIFSAEPLRFDLVITDMTLPKMTGIDLSREMLKIRPDIPIILCSGIKEPKTEAQVKILGIKAYLIKPMTKRDLAQAIRNAFDGQKKQAV